jgi:LysM repeat protein
VATQVPEVVAAVPVAATKSIKPTPVAPPGPTLTKDDLLIMRAEVEAAKQAAESEKAGTLVGEPKATVPTVTTSPVATTPAVVEEAPATYKVRKGDTLSGIAKANDIALAQLLDQNPQFTKDGRNPNLIRPGEEVNLGNTSPTDQRQTTEESKPEAKADKKVTEERIDPRVVDAYSLLEQEANKENVATLMALLSSYKAKNDELMRETWSAANAAKTYQQKVDAAPNAKDAGNWRKRAKQYRDSMLEYQSQIIPGSVTRELSSKVKQWQSK